MYLKFVNHDGNKDCLWLMHETKSYCVSSEGDNFRVYYDREKSLYEIVSKSAWLSCFVMNESGKTVDVIHAKH